MITLWFKYAFRNLRSGLKGFWILLSCLTLGVAALAIIGSLSSALQRGLDEQGQQLLGGDLEFATVQREASAAERAWITARGQLSTTAVVRAMAQTADDTALVEIKAVDGAYPLYGTLKLSPALPGVFASTGGRFGVAVDQTLLQRLNLKLNDTITLGQAKLEIRSVITEEPDRISAGIVFGPRVMMSDDALTATRLIQPGSLVTHAYHVKLNGATLSAAKALEEAANRQFPDAGWRIRTPDKAAQGTDEFIGRLGFFMTLVSIAALVVGGAGIANAVRAFVERRRDQIATLNCLGVAPRDIIAISLVEILTVGALGIVVALILGAAAPLVIKTLFGASLPLPLVTSVSAKPLVLAAVLGVLITTAFSLWPLSRITAIKGATLFRAQGLEGTGLPPRHFILASAALLLMAAAIIVFSFDDRRVSLIYLAGLLASFIVLALLAQGVLFLVRKLPQPHSFYLRQALNALARPGSATPSVIMALGLGLALFVTLALTDQTISRQLRSGIPEKAPAFFFLDVQNTELQAFKTKLGEQPGISDIDNSPMLRGRISKVKGVPADQVKASDDASWALKGDRGLTYANDLPKGSTLVSGKWWPTPYEGPPLVSMTDDIAKGLGLKVGDHITVNVLGRDVEAELANTRDVNWKSLGINFVMVFTPNTLVKAPHAHIVTAASSGDEGAVLRTIAKAYPSVTAVRVKEALETVASLLNKMLLAVRGANLVSLLTGVLVLTGALAAGLSTRSYEAVVLKTFGATRAQLLGCFLIEYAVLGLLAAVFGIITGTLASWGMAKFILQMPFVFSPGLAIATAVIAVTITILAGLSVTFVALSAKPSQYLRNG